MIYKTKSYPTFHPIQSYSYKYLVDERSTGKNINSFSKVVIGHTNKYIYRCQSPVRKHTVSYDSSYR